MMSFLPKIEKIAKQVFIAHFLLMFGYKLFSLYFPLFLVARGMSLPEVGFIYFLIYLPIAIFSPIVGFLNHKLNPALLATSGIFGYGIYVLGMILIPIYQTWQGINLFYVWQVFLGISAALFFVSARAILMGLRLRNPDQAFGWFYSAPFYVNVIAPIVGAFFIWKFDFSGVFIVSLIIFLFTAFFVFFKLRQPAKILIDQGFELADFRQSFQKVFQVVKRRNILPLMAAAFSVLLLAGFYQAFFVLFLREELFWPQNLILIFVSVFSFLFLPISLLLIKRLKKSQSKENIFQGGIVVGLFSILFGVTMPLLNFLSILAINIARSAGGLVCSASRSGLISSELKAYPEEASILDTIFAPLGIALGTLISGAIIGFLGFQFLFIVGGVFVIIMTLFAKKFAKIENMG